MVLLVVKGTRFPDEFVVERRVSDNVASSPIDASEGGEIKDGQVARATPAATDATAATGGGLTWEVCHIQNSRHRLRLMLMSAHELAEHLDAAQLTDEQRETLDEYKGLMEEQHAVLKDKLTPVHSVDQFDRVAAALRELTVRLYPAHCTKPNYKAAVGEDGAPIPEREAVIQELYAKHENPDLDEDERLVVYHCRAILDADWKSNECEKEEEAGLWFCGKLMASGPLSNYCGRNERSKVTVKVAPRTGPAPSGEPRIRYEDQRALYAHMRQRKEAYKTLEESELRDRVVRQSRGHVAMPSATGTATSGEGPALQTSQLRPIYPNRQERVVAE